MWTEGKKIMAIKDHSQGVFKEGDIFILKGIYSNICKCPLLKFDIGIMANRFIGKCPLCQEKIIQQEYGNVWLFNENLFKPLDEDFAESILEEVKKEIKKEELCEI